MASRLDLTDEQAAKVKAILVRKHSEMVAAVRAAFLTVHDEVREVLTDEQERKMEELHRRHPFHKLLRDMHH